MNMVRKELRKSDIKEGDIVILRNEKVYILTRFIPGPDTYSLEFRNRDDEKDDISLFEYDDKLYYSEDMAYDVMYIIKGMYYTWKSFFDKSEAFYKPEKLPKDFSIQREEIKVEKYTLRCSILYNFRKNGAYDTVNFEMEGTDLSNLKESLPVQIAANIINHKIPTGNASVEVFIERNGEYMDSDEYDGYITTGDECMAPGTLFIPDL